MKGSGDPNKDDEFRFFEEAAGDHSPRALINLTSNTAGTVFIGQKRKPLQAKITIKSITVTQTWSGGTTLNGKKMKPVTDAAVLEKIVKDHIANHYQDDLDAAKVQAITTAIKNTLTGSASGQLNQAQGVTAGKYAFFRKENPDSASDTDYIADIAAGGSGTSGAFTLADNNSTFYIGVSY